MNARAVAMVYGGGVLSTTAVTLVDPTPYSWLSYLVALVGVVVVRVAVTS